MTICWIAIAGTGAAASCSALDECSLADGDPAAAKAAFAIHQIEAPKAAEAFVKTFRQTPFVTGAVEVYPPGLERIGIIDSKILMVFP